MKKLIPIFIILILSASTLAQNEELIFKRGLESMEANRWDEAIRDFTEVIRLKPYSSAAYYRRGICFVNKKMAEPKTSAQTQDSSAQTQNSKAKSGGILPKSQNSLKAIADFAKVIQLNEHTVVAGYYGRATVYRLENDFEPAIADYEKVLQILQTLTNYEQEPLYQEAKDWLIKTRNDYARNLMLRATEATLYGLALKQNLTKLSGPERAHSQKQIDEYQKLSKNLYLKAAQTFSPNDNETFAERASCYESLENWNAAIVDYTQALKFQPDNVTTIMKRAHIYQKTGQTQISFSEFSRVIAMQNVPLKYKASQNNAYLGRAETFKEQGKLDEALIDLNKAIANNSGYLTAYKERGKIHVLKGNKELARADFRKATEKGSFLVEVQEQLDILDGRRQPQSAKTAETFLENGKKSVNEDNFKQAIAEFNEAIKLSPNSGEAHYFRGIALAQTGMMDEAIADLTKTIMFNYRRDLAYFNRGILYSRKKDYYWAIDSLTKSLNYDNTSAETYLARGVAYYHSQEFDKSIADFSQAITIAPNASNNYLWRSYSLCKKGLILSASNDHIKAVQLGAKAGKVCENLP